MSFIQGPFIRTPLLCRECREPATLVASNHVRAGSRALCIAGVLIQLSEGTGAGLPRGPSSGPSSRMKSSVALHPGRAKSTAYKSIEESNQRPAPRCHQLTPCLPPKTPPPTLQYAWVVGHCVSPVVLVRYAAVYPRYALIASASPFRNQDFECIREYALSYL